MPLRSLRMIGRQRRRLWISPLTATAEAQARSGHDILQMSDWYVAARADNLEPVDELVRSLIDEHGNVLLGSEYIGKHKGRWIAVPTGVQTTGQNPCAR